MRGLETNLQIEFVAQSEERFGVAFGIVYRVVSVACLPEVLEVLEGIANEPFVERAEIGGRKAKRIRAGEVVEVPIDELPVEAVVVGDEHGLTGGVLGEPRLESAHNGLRLG